MQRLYLFYIQLIYCILNVGYHHFENCNNLLTKILEFIWNLCIDLGFKSYIIASSKNSNLNINDFNKSKTT